MRTVLVVLGTRPEAIKLCPVILELRKPGSGFHVQVCVTGQHRELLAGPLETFGVVPDFSLEAMSAGQSLTASAARILSRLEGVLGQSRADLVLVQGDTTTTLCGALAGFYAGLPVVHVEAGLRTADPMTPFPEEMNRRLTTRASSLHFAATSWAAANLHKEGVAPRDVEVTGNPGIDALLMIWRRMTPQVESHAPGPAKRTVLVTAHRRESFGAGFEGICNAVRRIADRGDVGIAWPLHPNPKVRRAVVGTLGDHPEVRLLAPLDYAPFVGLMARSSFVLTDSGGIQEEAPSLGKPVLVMRDTTERPEAVRAGTARLVGCDPEAIVREAERLLDDSGELRRRSRIHNPYGDGCAAARIVEALRARFGERRLAAAG